ncbi:MAG: DUF6262 family protein [Prochloraceae cyanobacterium]|nr:DUF6262 family protein [Prochloraceae cyanobacterium]
MNNGKERTRESRINTLKEAQETRKQDAKNRVYQALKRLDKFQAKINFHTVAKEANVSVSYLYKYPELKQYISELRSQQNSLPVKPTAQPNSTSRGKIITRLQAKLKKLESENQELKRENKALAGKLTRFHLIEDQVKRLQQQNEDLKLAPQAIGEKVIFIQPKLNAESTNKELIKSELETLKIDLNSTLTKTIKAASSDTVLAAIEALKDQLTKQDISNPGGWLNRAIKQGWTKAEEMIQQSTNPEQKIIKTSEFPSKKLVSSARLKNLSSIFNPDG